jgi:hypothetical protein
MCEPQITSAASLDISAGDYSGGVQFAQFFPGMSDLEPPWPNDARSPEKSVMIVGPGGMGKTTVAVAVTPTMLEEFSRHRLLADVSSG